MMKQYLLIMLISSYLFSSSVYATKTFSNAKQIYIETVAWIPNPTLESLFRPPKI